MSRILLSLTLAWLSAQSVAVPPLEASAPAAKAAPAELLAQFSAARPAWTRACWDTADPATRKRGSYIAVLAFDGAGKQVIGGISEVRGASDPAIAQCLRAQLLNLSIPAHQAPATIEVPFDLP